MAKILPTDLFTGYSTDGTNITIPLTAIPGLTAGEADAATGNGAEILRLICETAYTKIEALSTNDRPTQMTWSKPAVQGLGAGVNRQNYTFGFNFGVDATAVNIADEPA